MSNFKINVVIVTIIAASVVLIITSAWNDSLIVDEIPHIGAGYSYLAKQDMRLNFEHPPLAKDVAAIPLMFAKLKQTAFDSGFWQQDINGQWEFGRLLIFNSGNNADLIRHLVKLPMILFFILSAVLIFRWGRKLYGDAGSIIALVLFAFSPTVIAHSRFVTTDVAALFGTLLATYFFVNYIKGPKNKKPLMAGLAFGIALVLKFSTFLLVPFFLILAIVYGFVKNPRPTSSKTPWILTKLKYASKSAGQTILIFIIGLIIVVWPVYYLNTYNYPPERQKSDTQYILSMVYGDSYVEYSPILKPVIFMSDKPLLRPVAQYLLGFLRVAHQNTEPHEVYFLGEISRFGWREYFPIVYFIKEPLAWWGLVLISILFLAWQWRYPPKEWLNRAYNLVRNNPDEFAMLLWLLIYWVASIQSTLNIGIRHLLPTYPFAILLVSGQITRIGTWLRAPSSRKKLATFYLLLVSFLGWYVYENLRVFPYYLTYFNQIVGGSSNGYKYVVDSNVDWGQDLIRFSNWVKENNIQKIEFDYFGWADPSYYLKNRYLWLTSNKYKDAFDFKARNQSDGWIAVSATFLQNSQGSEKNYNPANYLWLNSYQPITVIGNSIFVYRIK
ncbi:MAG: glycosyltransferase family 39 protein [Candidatus Yanofskybacteria bacterium]|nr:glycosyltransferase family 39 protein [Candidatus Yanofskybacteria bacterium]